MPAAHLDSTFAALADPTRRAILARLARGEATVTDAIFDGGGIGVYGGTGTFDRITALRKIFEAPSPAVGASACVMGVIGATIAILFRAWYRDRAHVAGSRLRLLVLMIGVQTVIDLTQAQISFKAHAAGLISGAILGYLLDGERPAGAR